jgi:hypothetical protein
MSVQTTENAELVEYGIEWLRSREVGELLDRNEWTTVARGLIEDESVRDRSRYVYNILWDWLYEELQAEERTLREVIGPELSDELVQYAREVELDEETARILFRNPAAEAMFGDVLYEGINEFLSRVDIIGAILDKIPLIGGIKGKVQSNIPDGIAGLVEGRIKQFLGNFSGAACEKGMNVVLSPDHRQDVRMVQAEVVNHYLDRPVREFLPDEERAQRWRDALWAGIEMNLDDLEETLSRVKRFYDEIESVPLERCIAGNPPGSVLELLGSTLGDFLSEERVHDWFEEKIGETA